MGCSRVENTQPGSSWGTLCRTWPRKAMLPLGTRRTVSRAVTFAGLELIKRKSLIKHCLKVIVREFLNFLLKETEVLMVCLFCLFQSCRLSAEYFMGQKFLWQQHCLKEAPNLSFTTLLSADRLRIGRGVLFSWECTCCLGVSWL